MKKIQKLKSKISNVHGQEFTGEYSTVKALVIETLGNASEISGENKIRAYHLAMKIKDCSDDEIEIEDQDADILKKAIDERKYIAQVHAQLYESIVDAEKK